MPDLAFLRAAVRWDAWRGSKMPIFFGCMYYAALTGPELSLPAIGSMAVLSAVLVAYAAFGHAINDLSDRRVDQAVGKPNAMATLSDRSAKLFVGALGALLLLATVLAFHDDVAALAILIACIVSAALYSMPPVRFKERGVAGIVVAALAQRTLPVTAIFEAMGAWSAAAVALCVWSTLTGVRYIVVHQVNDHAADVHAGVRTVATRVGRPLLWKVVLLILVPTEATILAFVVFLAPPALVLVQTAAIAFGVLLYLQSTLVKHKVLNLRSSPHTILLAFYCVYWPIALALTLAERDVRFVVLVVFTVAWQWKMLQAQWQAAASTTSAVRTVFARGS